MTVQDLRALIRWADIASSNTTFWRRLWCAAEAYDTRERVNIQAMCVNVGSWPLTASAESGILRASQECGTSGR